MYHSGKPAKGNPTLKSASRIENHKVLEKYLDSKIGNAYPNEGIKPLVIGLVRLLIV